MARARHLKRFEASRRAGSDSFPYGATRKFLARNWPVDAKRAMHRSDRPCSGRIVGHPEKGRPGLLPRSRLGGGERAQLQSATRTSYSASQPSEKRRAAQTSLIRIGARCATRLPKRCCDTVTGL
jgi:hypothetical protein